MSALALLLAATPAMAQSKLDEVLARGHLIVGTGTPMRRGTSRTRRQAVGFDVDIARILAKGLFDDPEKVEFVHAGFRRAHSERA